MAGIGFELKKLLNRDSIISKASGYLYATFVTIGPLLIVVAFLVVVRDVLKVMHVPIESQNVLLAAITYSFISSLIISGLFAMLWSRFISDMLYKNEEKKVFPSFITAVVLNIILSSLSSLIFLIFIAKLPIWYKVLYYFMGIFISTTFVIMIYISAVKDYKKITYGFIIGCVLGLLAEFALRTIVGINPVYTVLIAFNVAFLYIAISLSICVYKYFRVSDDSYFEILTYIKKKPRLISINTMYFIGIYIHSFIVWSSKYKMVVNESFVVSPIYDVPSFYALLSAMPAMVLFVIKTETNFYEYYKEYVKVLLGGGTLKDLRFAGNTMKDSIYTELISLLQTQLAITILCIILSRIFLHNLSFSDFEINIFCYMSLGYLCIVGVNIIASIILYFDDTISAQQIMAFFLISHIICVVISLYQGGQHLGYGTTIAGILSITFAFIKLWLMLKNLDYRLYCSQPVIAEDD